MSSALNEIWGDLHSGWKRRELWLILGWRDILLRYRRSRLGPFWITISMGIMAAALGSLYSIILDRDPHVYIPYLVLGWTAWYFLSALVLDSCQVFVANAASVREINAPKSIYVYRTVWRNLIVFAHNILIYVAVVFIFQLWPTTSILLLIPATIIYMLNGMWLGFLLGMINVRYRDVAQMVGNIIRMMFFVTPIIWQAEGGRVPSYVTDYNPFYYFIEIMRAPLLGTVPPIHVWFVAIAITAVGWVAAVLVYKRYNSRIAFWV